MKNGFQLLYYIQSRFFDLRMIHLHLFSFQSHAKIIIKNKKKLLPFEFISGLFLIAFVVNNMK